jgi:hypothetical protein
LFSNKILALKNLNFWDQLKASFSSNICPDCISCHLELQNFQGEDPRTPSWANITHPPKPPPAHAYGARGHACGMSSLQCDIGLPSRKMLKLSSLFTNDILGIIDGERTKCYNNKNYTLLINPGLIKIKQNVINDQATTIFHTHSNSLLLYYVVTTGH